MLLFLAAVVLCFVSCVDSKALGPGQAVSSVVHDKRSEDHVKNTRTKDQDRESVSVELPEDGKEYEEEEDWLKGFALLLITFSISFSLLTPFVFSLSVRMFFLFERSFLFVLSPTSLFSKGPNS